MSRLLGHYVDRSGRPAIDGKYLDPQPFADGCARVSSARDARVGLIDRGGKLLVDYRYDFIHAPVGGVLRTNNGGRMQDGYIEGGAWGLLAPDGRELVAPAWDLLLDPGDGRITCYRDRKVGFLDSAGAVVIEPRYPHASWYQDGLA